MASKLPSSQRRPENDTTSIETVLSKLSDERLLGKFDDIYKLMPVTEETSCGIGLFRGSIIQRFANKKCLVAVFGVISLVFVAAGSYFNGTITTLEKRFNIPSKNVGIISVGNDITSLVLSSVIAYIGGKSHRPRWIGIGLALIVCYALLTALPHFIFGSGNEALSLTVEYNDGIETDSKKFEALEAENRKLLCRQPNTTDDTLECEKDGGNLLPQIILFMAQLVAGIGQTICSTLGISYMDDNIKKSKTPALMSISFFMRLLGPAVGYAIASFCLRFYISPSLTPIIDNKDPRWLGAWWMGWLFFAGVLLIASCSVLMFPRELPRAAVRRRIEKEKIRRGLKEVAEHLQQEDTKASLNDMLQTFKRLLQNKIFMLMNVAGTLHLFGFLPYWIYTPKYIETIYHQSASTSSFYTGTFAIVFSGLGVLLGGVFISRFKPSARFLTMWHIIVGACCVIGVISYAFMGCSESEKTLYTKDETTQACSDKCNCDFVRYSPVCGSDFITYTSACHAGCRMANHKNGTRSFGDCSCIQKDKEDHWQNRQTTFSWEKLPNSASPGSCKVNCQKELYIFLFVMCFLKFIGATGRTSNFLVSIRCVDEKDKTVALGVGSSMVHLLAFIPSPILFGYIMDKTCDVWGRTCSGTGNCWQYDAENLRYLLNFVAAFFIALGTIVDCFVWYYVKDLKIFDEDEMESIESEKKRERY